MKIGKPEILAIVIFAVVIFSILFLARTAGAVTNEELERYAAQESESITSRLDRGEIVELNGTKLIKRNGVVYGLGEDTETNKELYEKNRQEQKDYADRDAQWKHDLDMQKARGGEDFYLHNN